MEGFHGQVALVTGCSRQRGIGRSIALALARAGADIAVTDITPEGTSNRNETNTPEREANWQGLNSVVSEIEAMGRRAIALTGNVGCKTDAEQMLTQAIKQLGKVDILVNNAAAPHGDDRNWSWLVPEEAFDHVMTVNTKGAFLMSTAVIRHLLERGTNEEQSDGRIINIASGAGKRGFPQRTAYCTSKFAVIGMTQSMAQELGTYGITVNAICPGAVDTSRQASRDSDEQTSSQNLLMNSAINRLGTTSDVAEIAVFLASPAASFITGQAINVDGGLLMD